MRTNSSMPFKGETFPSYFLRSNPVATPSPSINLLPKTVPIPINNFKQTDNSFPSSKQEPKCHSQRPSLSTQLERISQQAQALTAHLVTTYHLPGSSSIYDKIELQVLTISLTVGRLDCRFPCPITFYSDRCTYLFQHPFETKEVRMIMYYRDMLQAHIRLLPRTFRFRLSRVLEQFQDDYNPANTHHWLEILFATSSDVQKVQLLLIKLGVMHKQRAR